MRVGKAWVTLVVGLIAILPAWSILDAQFSGEDEAMTLNLAADLGQAIGERDLRSFGSLLLHD